MERLYPLYCQIEKSQGSKKLVTLTSNLASS